SGSAFTANLTLAEGDNSIVATALDDAGHPATASIVVVLDTLPPTVAIDNTLPALTGDATATVTGTVSDPHLETVTVNGVAAEVANGEFAATGVPLVEGANDLVAHAVDSLGHPADSAARRIERDSLPPEIAVTEPAANAHLTSRTATVRGTVRD